MSKTEIIKKRNNKDRILLDSWHPYIYKAINAVHDKFKTDSKFILTESDLKCWLFYYLQKQEPYIKYGVHTEVTHYAEHVVNNINDNNGETKYKFRDLSLLCPWKIEANEEFIDKNQASGKLLNKGFKHKAPAIHFELKFVSENGGNNQVSGLSNDLKKLNKYNPADDSRIRDFVILCGSRSENTSVDNFENILHASNKDVLKDKLKDRVWIYLFDKEKLVVFKYISTNCELLKINSLKEMLENVRINNN